MSGCHPVNECHHVDGEFCDKCYKPQEEKFITLSKAIIKVLISKEKMICPTCKGGGILFNKD